MPSTPVTQLRLVVTVDDLDAAIRFYRDELGLPEEAAFTAEGRRVVILDAGRATVELGDAGHADYIDAVEVGRRVAGHIRVAFEVGDAAASTATLVDAGATLLAPPTVTPWNSLNSRLDAPGGLQLTLFEALGEERMS
jgi:catechol 2,3-dioxygenase-like lactoylglutathione lyase family enzyme